METDSTAARYGPHTSPPAVHSLTARRTADSTIDERKESKRGGKGGRLSRDEAALIEETHGRAPGHSSRSEEQSGLCSPAGSQARLGTDRLCICFFFLSYFFFFCPPTEMCSCALGPMHLPFNFAPLAGLVLLRPGQLGERRKPNPENPTLPLLIPSFAHVKGARPMTRSFPSPPESTLQRRATRDGRAAARCLLAAKRQWLPLTPVPETLVPNFPSFLTT